MPLTSKRSISDGANVFRGETRGLLWLGMGSVSAGAIFSVWPSVSISPSVHVPVCPDIYHTSICADSVSQLCHGVGGLLWPVWVVILEASWVLPMHRGHWALLPQPCHPHHHGDVLSVEPHSCEQWKQLLICVERLLAVYLHCLFCGGTRKQCSDDLECEISKSG